MALSADVRIVRYGTPGNSTQPVNQPLTGSSTTVYRGSVATTRSGYLVAPTTPQATDIVWGLIESAGPGTPNIVPGITNAGSSGDVTAEIATGSFFLASGTGADALTQANVGAVVYLIDEITVGATSGGSSRPVAGVMEAYDATVVDSLGPIAVKLGTNSIPGGPS